MVRRVRWIYPAVLGALVIIFYAAPAAQKAVVALVGLASVGCVVVAVLVYRPARAPAWWCLAAGMLVVAAGQFSYDLLATGSRVDPFPSWPDLLYLSAYPLLAVGLLWLGLARVPSRDLTGWIETAALTLAGTLLMWITLIDPTVTSMHLSGMGKAVMVAGWIGDVAVLAAAVRVVTVWSRNLAAVLLGCAVLALLAGNVAYGVDMIGGRWHSGGLADLGLLAFFALAGYAACSPSMAGIGSVADAGRRNHPTGLVALAIALLIAPTALVTEATSGPVRTPYAVAIVSAAIGGLVWWRMALAVGSHRRATARAADVRRASRQLALTMDTEAVTAILATALARMTHGTPTSVRIDTDPTATTTPSDAGHLAIAVDRGLIIFAAPPADLIELEDTLVSLSSQAGITLERIELSDQISTSRQEQAVLAYRAAHDPLTGLANADTFRNHLRTAAHTHTAASAVAAVLFLDLDDFKAINDTLGHAAGDAVLVTAADAIRGCLRRDDVGARFGGDEFAVLLRNLATPTDAEQVAQRIIAALQAPTLIGGLPVVCRVSIGLATASRPQDYDTVLRHADTALYAAKTTGKGHWLRYHPDMPSPLHTGGTDSDVRQLLDLAGHPNSGDGLALHYQPIVTLATGNVEGYEALIRWRPADGTAVAAQDLIDSAERAGLMPLIGDWVLRQALTDLPRLPNTGPTPSYLAINVSATQLRRGTFLDRVRDHLTDATPGNRLVLEITENQLLADNDPIWDDLRRLREFGIRIAIDDYGTGYASLAYLRHRTVDIVKLDHSFLHDPDDPRSDILLRSVIDLTRRLGVTLIAEGIDNNNTRRRLIHLGYRLGQGHLFAPAMPLTELQTWIPPTYR